MSQLDVCSTFARCLLDVCSTFARRLLDVCSMFAMLYACFIIICSMFARYLLDVCSMSAGCLLDRVNEVLICLYSCLSVSPVCLSVRLGIQQSASAVTESRRIPAASLCCRDVIGLDFVAGRQDGRPTAASHRLATSGSGRRRAMLPAETRRR